MTPQLFFSLYRKNPIREPILEPHNVILAGWNLLVGGTIFQGWTIWVKLFFLRLNRVLKSQSYSFR
jgi:hypothetical protein